jgi:large subunit ribosomal protein L23
VKQSYNVIQKVLVTEKGTRLTSDENKYLFHVDVRAAKSDIRRAIEELFSVHVTKVNTMVRAGKKKRERTPSYGRTSDWKRAVVTLKSGETIPLQ